MQVYTQNMSLMQGEYFGGESVDGYGLCGPECLVAEGNPHS